MPSFEPAHIVLAILAASLVLFVTDRVRYDLVAVGVALALALTGTLTTAEAFAGFSSPAVLLVASMYVFGAALSRSGVAEALGQRLLAARAGRETALVFRVALVSGLLSSVLSNAGVVAILIPVLASASRRSGVPASRLMMPLAFGSLLGGLVTVIGTSHNLAINGVVETFHGRPLGLFEFTPYGLSMVVIGALYFLGPGRTLLPRKRVDESLSEHYQIPQFVTEVLVEPASTLVNRTVADAEFFDRYGVSVLGILRPDASAVLAPGPYNRIRRDDTLVLQGEPESLVRLREELGMPLVASKQVGDATLHSGDVHLVEAVIPAGSGLVGRTLVEAEFRAQSGLNVLALSKHGEQRLGHINEVPLDVGDTLLIQGHRRDVERARRERQLLILGELEPRRVGRQAWISAGVLVAVLVLVAFDLAPLTLAAIAGALALVLTGCVPTKDLYRSMDWPALVLIGGMLAQGAAFRKTGLDREIANALGEFGRSMGSGHLTVAALLAATVLLTQLTTHVAAAVVMAPIALSIANEMQVSDRPLLMAVVTGASLAFMTPVAHQANAMVAGPGDYRYRDFLRVGTPLTLLLYGYAVAVIPWIWPLERVAP